MSHLLAQKVLFASVDEAVSWTKVAFHKLKYNLILHVNDLFNVDNSEMRDRLRDWKERLEQMKTKHKEWEKLALQDQDRVRQEVGVLAANGSEPALEKLTLARRQAAGETLALLQLLNEEMASVQWLIDQLEHHIRTHSHFFARAWGDFVDTTASIWKATLDSLNVSLFKGI